MRNPFRRRRTVLVLTRPDSNVEPLTPSEVEAVRDWSLAGMPTSAAITLQLIEVIDRAVPVELDDWDPRRPSR